MADVHKIFGDYSPTSIKAGTEALSWVAKEIANSNNFSAEQTATLKQLLHSNEELKEFFTTAKPDGFEAMRDKKFEKLVDEALIKMQDPIQKIVHEETKKVWRLFTIILSAILGILTYIFSWINTNHIEAAIQSFIENIPK